MQLYDILTSTASNIPDHPAVICGSERFTYSEFMNRVDNVAQFLKDLGIGIGDRIAVIHENCHRFLESYFASARIGAVLVPMNYRLTPNDFMYLHEHSAAKVLICQDEFVGWVFEREHVLPNLERIIVSPGSGIGACDGKIWKGDTILNYEELTGNVTRGGRIAEGCEPAVVDESDIAQIYYTSGTTGVPKGVVLTHGNNLAHAEGAVRELGLTSRDRWLHVSPMFHLADAWAVWSMTRVGGVHVIVPRFEPALVLETIQDRGVTLSNFIPTMLNILVNYQKVRNYDFGTLRLLMSGGAPIAREVVKRVIDVFGCEYIQTYGLTETSPFLTMSILRDWMRTLPFEDRLRYLVTTGRPFHDVELKVVREDGSEVVRDEHEVGEIIVRGKTVTPGYWKAPEITAERIVDGWLHTRDLAVVNEEGYVTIVDRLDDMIITGGESVYCVEVEDVLYSHPDVFEAAVVGLPDPVWGERVVAVVVPKEGGKEGELDPDGREEGGSTMLKEGGRAWVEGAGAGNHMTDRTAGVQGGEVRSPIMNVQTNVTQEKKTKKLTQEKKARKVTEEEIIEFCKERIARYKAPKQVFFMNELPKTGSSKIRKFALREMLMRD